LEELLCVDTNPPLHGHVLAKTGVCVIFLYCMKV